MVPSFAPRCPGILPSASPFSSARENDNVSVASASSPVSAGSAIPIAAAVLAGAASAVATVKWLTLESGFR